MIPTLCAQCGKELPEGATQCPHCGAALAAAPPPAPVVPAKPHRGTMILVFGILGLVFSGLGCCLFGLPLGIAAWVMGNHDLAEMDAGRMDPSGRGTTQAAKVCGIISVPLAFVVLAVSILVSLPMIMSDVMSELGNR